MRKWGEALSEMQEALFGESAGTGNDENNNNNEVYEIDGQVTLGEAYQPDYTDTEENVGTPEDMIRESMDAVERMKQEIAEETKNIDRRFAESGAVRTAQHHVSRRRSVYVIGVISAAASLIFMGIALLISLSSPIGAYSAIKLAPVMLIFLGAEIVFAIVRRKSLRIKVDLRSIIIIAALIILTSVLSIVSVNSSAGNGERLYAEQRIQNMLASRLHDTIAKDYIRSVDIETQLFGENAEMYETPADLTDGDVINLTVYFSDAQMPIRDFAAECRDILDDINKLSYNFGQINFIADDTVNHYTLDVDWHYQSGYSADRLAALVNYFGDGISDNDIPDISEE